MTPLEPGAGVGEPMTWARKVFVSEEMAAEWWTRTDDGRRLTVEWGEPDDEGFYTPTLTATDDGWLTGLLQAARAEVGAEIRAGVEELDRHRCEPCEPDPAGWMLDRAAVLALLPPSEPKA